MKHILSVVLFLSLLSCSEKDTPMQPVQPSGPDFALSIPTHRILTWYYDSAMTRWIKPSTFSVLCPSGGCMMIITGGAYDYTCTELPDTFYGVIEYTTGPEGDINDTLICRNGSCYDKKDGKYYDMGDYLRWMKQALCDSAAASYSKIGLCMSSLPGDTLRAWNNCFDTTFYNGSDFCLPKLPIPLDSTQQGVFVSSAKYRDTVFLPAGYINTHDDYILFPQLQ